MQAEIDAGNFLEACQVQHGAEAHLYGSSLVTVRGVASTGETTLVHMLIWACAVYISPAACAGSAALDRLRQAQHSGGHAVSHWGKGSAKVIFGPSKCLRGTECPAPMLQAGCA